MDLELHDSESLIEGLKRSSSLWVDWRDGHAAPTDTRYGEVATRVGATDPTLGDDGWEFSGSNGWQLDMTDVAPRMTGLLYGFAVVEIASGGSHQEPMAWRAGSGAGDEGFHLRCNAGNTPLIETCNGVSEATATVAGDVQFGIPAVWNFLVWSGFAASLSWGVPSNASVVGGPPFSTDAAVPLYIGCGGGGNARLLSGSKIRGFGLWGSSQNNGTGDWKAEAIGRHFGSSNQPDVV